MKRPKCLEIDYNPYQGKIVSKSNKIIGKQTALTGNQLKLFSIALRELQRVEGCCVNLNKSYLADYLNYNTEYSFQQMARDLSGMSDRSGMKFMNQASRRFTDIRVITRVDIDGNDVFIKFHEDIIDQLKAVSRNYTKYFQDDYCNMQSKFSMRLYEDLMRLHHACYKGVQHTTEQLFEVFCLAKDAYKNKRGVFQRYNFEKKTLNVALTEINAKAKCIQDLSVEKIKNAKGETLYIFKYMYISPNKSAKIYTSADKSDDFFKLPGLPDY